jgi:RNA polymerase sigma factor (sigma-70 family)
MQDDTDSELRLAALMRSAQAGDTTAYRRLLMEVSSLLRRQLRRWRPNLQHSDIEDFVQDVLLSLHAVRATYDPRRPFLPWLMGIAPKRVADGVRRYARRAANEIGADRLPETFAVKSTNVSSDRYGDPQALRLAMQRLPRNQRNAIEMLKLREMSLKEAAVASGASVAALKVAAHRGMKALKKALSAMS